LTNLNSNIEYLTFTFDNLNEIREKSLSISREIIRDCSKSIRHIHRNDTNGAKQYLDAASLNVKKLKNLCKNVSEINNAGYVLDAEREFVEAVLVYKYELEGSVEVFKKFSVHPSSYIQGIGDAIGEWRRKALDSLKELNLKKSEEYLHVMEECLGILVELDYPDALTGGLRRYADNAKSLIEKTRSEITSAFISESLRKDISKITTNEL